MPKQMVPRQGYNWYASLWTGLICPFLDKVHQHYCQGEPNFRHTPMSTSRCICLLLGMGQISASSLLSNRRLSLALKHIPDSCLLWNRQPRLTMKQVQTASCISCWNKFLIHACQTASRISCWNKFLIHACQTASRISVSYTHLTLPTSSYV